MSRKSISTENPSLRNTLNKSSSYKDRIEIEYIASDTFSFKEEVMRNKKTQ